MNLNLIWSVAAIAYSLAFVASLGLGWAVWRRAPRRRETGLLVGAIATLSLHYASAAIDAFLHSAGEPAMFTVWSAVGETALVVFWMLLCLFLLAVVQRLEAPERPDRSSVWALVAANMMVSAAMLFLLVNAVHYMWSGASTDVSQSQLRRVMCAMNQVIPIWLITPSWLFAKLRDGLPRADQTGLVAFLSNGPHNQLTSLNLAEYPARSVLQLPGFSRRDFKLLSGIFIPGLLLLVIGALNNFEAWTPMLVTGAALFRLLLLPSILSIVYYLTRFSFLDVVLKRGVLFVLLSLVVSMAAYSASVRFLTPPQTAVLCVGSALVVWTLASLLGHGDRLLDRLIFHRPDYRMELRSISDEISRAPNADGLSAMVTARLARTLDAEFVEFNPELKRPAELVIQIGTPGRSRGCLAFGPRNQGQHYASEDLSFIDAVASQFAALLESFEARQAERLATIAELRALRAQINPHFLFNALNTVAEMARGAPEAEQAILNLSRVFRYALESTRRETVPLADELDALRAYLDIERARFEDQLRYEIDAPGDVLQTPVPPMLIQPLVENALKHGISPQLGGGTLKIVARRTARGLRITVIDDGVGFDLASTPTNVGLSNVRERVEKNGGVWMVKSKRGQGTEISMELVTA